MICTFECVASKMSWSVHALVQHTDDADAILDDDEEYHVPGVLGLAITGPQLFGAARHRRLRCQPLKAILQGLEIAVRLTVACIREIEYS